MFKNKLIKGVEWFGTPYTKKAYKILFSEKEGSVRAGRRYQPLDSIRITRLDLLGLQTTYQQILEISKLHGSDRGTHTAFKRGGKTYVGQRGTESRTLQLHETVMPARRA